MPHFAIIDAPSILGLKPTGVEQLPEALKTAGLQAGLNAEYAGLVTPPPYNYKRDPKTLFLNLDELRTYAQQLAEAVSSVLGQGKFPIVLGGDCSNLIGCTLALRRLGRFGLVFIDGHADFYQPEKEPNGEVASMDLAIVSGRGPDALTNIDGFKPLLRDEDIVLFGYRDCEQQMEYESKVTLQFFFLRLFSLFHAELKALKESDRVHIPYHYAFACNLLDRSHP